MATHSLRNDDEKIRNLFIMAASSSRCGQASMGDDGRSPQVCAFSLRRRLTSDRQPQTTGCRITRKTRFFFSCSREADRRRTSYIVMAETLSLTRREHPHRFDDSSRKQALTSSHACCTSSTSLFRFCFAQRVRKNSAEVAES